MKTYLTLTEAGHRLGISRQMVRRYIDEGRIRGTQVAGRMLVESRACKRPAPRKRGPKPH